jgi:hypothetical protein
MSSTAPDQGLAALVPLTGGASLALRLPQDAVAEPDEALPTIDVSALPGAWIAARRGYRAGSLALRTVCAAAPADGWADGVEEIVLDHATALARGSLGGEVTRFEAGDPKLVGSRFEQGFEGSLTRGGEALAVRGRHWLGFAGEPRAALVCTLACVEPAASRSCEGLVAAAAPAGTWTGAPPPSLLARALVLSAEHPWEAAAVLAVVSLAAAALSLARRPRPRP